jgi:hypothetical protein
MVFNVGAWYDWLVTESKHFLDTLVSQAVPHLPPVGVAFLNTQPREASDCWVSGFMLPRKQSAHPPSRARGGRDVPRGERHNPKLQIPATLSTSVMPKGTERIFSRILTSPSYLPSPYPLGTA